jgi:hypothetical protein
MTTISEQKQADASPWSGSKTCSSRGDCCGACSATYDRGAAVFAAQREALQQAAAR